jgi:hypothetical protein
VNVPAREPLGVVRLYLPAGDGKPVEVDWIEVCSQEPGAKPQRWEFAAANSQ